MKKIIATLTVIIMLLSCNNANEKKASQNLVSKANFEIIGKKAVLLFPEIKAEVYYKSDSILHWKTTDKKGIVAEGDEKMDYKQLSENLHFLNWIEQDGWTVSQIIDSKNGTVKAFWSFQDETSPRGKRRSLFVNGKFEFVK